MFAILAPGLLNPERVAVILGACLCRAVTFVIDRVPDVANICHCSMCRKTSGSSYGVFAHSPRASFQWQGGERLISTFQSSQDSHRSFCSVCGSPVPVIDGDYVSIPAGSFDDDPGVRPSIQIFAGSKAPWHAPDPQIPAYDQFEPDD